MYEKRKIFFAGLVSGALLCLLPCHTSAAEFPDFIEINDLGNIYEPVVFDHAMHTDITSCGACHHHTTGGPAEDEICLPCHQKSGSTDTVACGGCHPRQEWPAEEKRPLALKAGEQFHIDSAGLKRAYHVSCLGCHREMEVSSGCEDCHSKRGTADDVARAAD